MWQSVQPTLFSTWRGIILELRFLPVAIRAQDVRDLLIGKLQLYHT